jgi:hypothetical protein
MRANVERSRIFLNHIRQLRTSLSIVAALALSGFLLMCWFHPSSASPIRNRQSAISNRLPSSKAGKTIRTIWDGVYTERQADRGQRLYERECVACHTRNEFTGPVFVGRWSGRTVHDLFETLRTTMPQENPGRLRRQEYADLAAYLFMRNEFPTGETELSADAGRLKQIRIEPK